MVIYLRNNAIQVINVVNKEGNKLMAGYTILIFLLKEIKKGFYKNYI